MLVERGNAFFARALHDGPPPALQRAFKKAGEHIIKAPALEMVKPDFGHGRSTLTAPRS
jgi:hypothetical protein